MGGACSDGGGTLDECLIEGEWFWLKKTASMYTPHEQVMQRVLDAYESIISKPFVLIGGSIPRLAEIKVNSTFQRARLVGLKHGFEFVLGERLNVSSWAGKSDYTFLVDIYAHSLQSYDDLINFSKGLRIKLNELSEMHGR